MGLRSLPTLLLQSLSGLVVVRPRVLVVGANLDLVDNADGTASLSASGGGGSAFCGASVYNNGSDQTLPATTNTLLIWSTASGAVTAYDSDGLFAGGDPTKLTIPAGKTGKWQVGGSVDIYGSDPGSGNRKVDIKVNGSNKLTPFLYHNVNAPDEECYTFSWVFNLTAGDYVELNFYNASAVDLFLSNGAGSSVFQMTYLGA